MSRLLYVVTHPEVEARADVAVPDWSLSELGRRRAQGLLQLDWVSAVRHVFSSSERKALETAELLAQASGAGAVVVDIELGENDRSATGFVPPTEFEQLADQFFASPTQSVRGWETALDAQQRIASAVERCLGQTTDGDVAIVCHGGVGTLLWCRLSGEVIDRRHDQPGQGSWYSVDLHTQKPLGAWQRVPLPEP